MIVAEMSHLAESRLTYTVREVAISNAALFVHNWAAKEECMKCGLLLEFE